MEEFDFGKKKKKNKKEEDTLQNTSQNTSQKENDYTYDFLLKRFYELKSEKIKKITIKAPKIVRISTKKICWINFIIFCKEINREESHIKNFIDLEINAKTVSSINKEGHLIINAILKEEQITTIITRYLNEFLRCKSCKKFDTKIIKENKIKFIECNGCKAKISIK